MFASALQISVPENKKTGKFKNIQVVFVFRRIVRAALLKRGSYSAYLEILTGDHDTPTFASPPLAQMSGTTYWPSDKLLPMQVDEESYYSLYVQQIQQGSVYTLNIQHVYV